MRCLEKDPWDRFSTMKELRGALESVTFFGTRRETAPSEASSGTDGVPVALIAGIALVVGVLIGWAIG